MFENEKKINNLFLYWLYSSLILVFSIIIVGGLTRLTNSGLSITEWELFKGILPPLDQKTWIDYFNHYKKIPQFKLLNPTMDLNEFKVIFYWEYFHRILARLIGLFFLIPLLFFFISKKIKKNYLNTCYIIFFLILLQGAMGWYMVMSGLVNDVTVSHYRLSVHLTLAFIIISTIFWLIKNFKDKKAVVFFSYNKKNIPFLILILIIFIQIIFGAFVSGLDAGQIYQTWPLMGDDFIPNDLAIDEIYNAMDFNNQSLVQFYHRNLAYFIILYTCYLSFYIYKNKLLKLFLSLKIIFIALLLQISLGIFTLISNLNILIASAHQISSVILLICAINLYYYRAN